MKIHSNNIKLWQSPLVCILLVVFTHSLAKTNSTQKEQAKGWIKDQLVKFLENKGQMMDMEGNPVPFVLFKAEAPGINVFITEQGLTWQTLKIEEENENNEEAELEEKGGLSPSLPKGKGEHSTSELRSQPSVVLREGLGWAEECIKIEWERIDVLLKGANIKKENIIKEIPSETNFNFFYPHCDYGIYGVKEYEKITIKDVYPGIDWVFYNSSDKGFKYDFIVNPGADYKQIELVYKSKKPIRINSKGEIEITTLHGNINENAPISFVDENKIPSRFIQNYQRAIAVNGDAGYETSIGFDLKPYPANSQLIIDPQLWWATFYGGSSYDGPMSIDTDNNGNVVITGYLSSLNFPLQNNSTFFQGTINGSEDAFILKFNNAGNLLWATYYGGSDSEGGNSIITDANGNIFVTGLTSSSNLPVLNSGTLFQGTSNGSVDAFILKFDNAGTRLWATYYGGSGNDQGRSLAIDASDNLFVTGSSDSPNLPVQSAFQGTLGGLMDAFILKFDNAGNRQWATYCGGSGYDESYAIAVDGIGNTFVTGYTSSANFPVQTAATFFQGTLNGSSDAFILKFDNAGVKLWATYYGGSMSDWGTSIITDGAGNVFVTGNTESSNFPTQNSGTFFQGTLNAWQDAFILKFNNSGTRLWATYYGGNGTESSGTFNNLGIDKCENIYMSLNTNSTNLSVQSLCDGGYYDNSLNSSTDIAILLFDNIGNRIWTTYLGGDGSEYREALALDGNNNLFITGEWNYVVNTGTYPLTNPGSGTYYDGSVNGNDDGFILKFIPVSIQATTTLTLPDCSNSCGGSAAVNIVSPATCTYTYLWSNSQTTQTATGLCAGTYTVNIKNQLCKDTSLVVTITSNGSLTLNSTNTPANCGNNNGTATVNTSGGTNPFTYTWGNGQTASTATGLSAGTYTVTVTDANGCSNTQTVIITSNSTLSVTLSSTQSGCTVNNGMATVSPSSGTAPYTYSWSNGQTTSTATGLGAGSYTATITDASGCIKTETITVTSSNNNLTVTTTSTPAGCTVNNGTATANASNGTPGYTYSWNNGQTTQTATALGSGSYTVTATDASGCTQTQTVAVTSNNTLSVTTTSTPAGCTINNGTAAANASGGTGSLVYNWDNGQTTQTATGLAAGNYTATVTDANGCTQTQTVAVTSSSALSITTTSTQAGCTVYNGTATANGNNGTTPYTYSWNNGQTSQTATGLPVGNYTITVIDANGCTQTQTISVTQTPGPTASASASSSIIASGASSTLTATGGGIYLWSPAASLSDPNIASPLATPSQTTSYCVKVTDANGCEDSTCITITVDIPCGTIYIPNAFSPNNDSENDLECVFGSCIEIFYIAIYDRWGELVFDSNDKNICWDGTYKGKPLNTAVFDYYLKATLTSGKEINTKGNISLIR